MLRQATVGSSPVRRGLLWVAICLACTTPAAAIDRVWDGSVDNDFNTANNWTPAGVPSNVDNATIGIGATVTTTVFSWVENLDLEDGGWLVLGTGTNNGYVLVDDRTTLNKTTNVSVQLFVNDTDFSIDFDTEFMDILNGAELDMQGGLCQVDRILTNDADSFVTGNGIIELIGTTAGDQFDNEGSILADGTTLTIRRTASSVATLDLDGDVGLGSLTASSGTVDVVIDMPLSDAFDGTITVGDGNTVTFNDGWTLNASGVLYLTGGASGSAVVNGLSSVIAGDVNVADLATIGSTTTSFAGTANVSVGAGGTLSVTGTTTYSGGTYTGAGQISQDGDATIAATTTIATGSYDLDGVSGFTETTINNGVNLNLTVGTIDDGNDLFNGTLTLNGGNLLINNTANFWTMNGVLNLNEVGGNFGDILAGDRMDVGGTIVATGRNRIFSGVQFTSTADVTVNAASHLSLFGQTAFDGGAYAGAGELEQNATAFVLASTTIGTARYDMDGSGENSTINVAAGVTFTLNVNELDDGNDTFDGTLNLNGGSIDVSVADFGWSQTGVINMTQVGADIPHISGDSLASMAATINVTGHAVINPFTDFEASAVINVPNPVDNLHLQSFTNVGGGTWQGNGVVTNDGSMSVSANTTFNQAVFDADGDIGFGDLNVLGGVTFNVNSVAFENDGDGFGGVITIANNARLNVNTIATWTIDTGTLSLVGPNSILGGQALGITDPLGRVEGTGLIVNDVTSAGVISPGASAGVIQIASDLALTATSTLDMEIGGVAPANYDRILVANTALLGGVLELSVIAPFVPDYGDVYAIVSATLGISNCFSSIVGMDIPGPLVLALDYTATQVLIRPTVPGDANFDGTVTGADYTLWADGFGDMCPDFGMGDFNGDGAVTGADYTIWADHFGQVAAPPAAQAVPEPGSAVMATGTLLLLAILAVRKRDRQSRARNHQ